MAYTKVRWERGELVNTTGLNANSPVKADCADIMFINLGATTAYVHGMPLISGASVTFGANQNEWNDTEYYVQAAQPVAVGGYAMGVYVYRKNYLQ